MIRPLCGRITPFVGESLASIVARSACANENPSTKKLLQQGVREWGRPAFVAFTQTDIADDLARLLGLPVNDVVARMHPKILGEHSNRIDWFGTPLERRFVEAPKRRFSCLGLLSSDFVRAEWMIRPLAYCPENFDLLRHECPHCNAQLGWERALGISVCDKCERDIRSAPVHLLTEEWRSTYSIICGLIATDPARRAVSVKNFPDPFGAWQPGDLFSAIVDLGFAIGSPGGPSRSPLANGDFASFTEEHLLLGYSLLMNWEDQFESILQGVMRRQSGTASRGTRDSLGPFGKFFYPNISRTPLVDLMRREIPLALRNLNMPLRVARNSTLLGTKREGTISLRDAREKYRIDNRLLGRLVDKGDCFIARHDSKFGTRLFHEGGLAEAISAFRAGTTIEVLARELGVPPCIVDACADVGLFERIKISDAQLLAGDMTLYDTGSVRAFTSAFQQECEGHNSLTDTSLLEGMQGQLNPATWAHIFKALVTGTLRFRIDHAEKAWSCSIRIERMEMDCALAKLPNYPLPQGLRLSMGNAAVLLGESATSLGCAARIGLLTAERHDTRYNVALPDLDAFRQRYVFNHELTKAYANSDVFWRTSVKRAGLEPVARLGGRHCWDRRAVSKLIS